MISDIMVHAIMKNVVVTSDCSKKLNLSYLILSTLGHKEALCVIHKTLYDREQSKLKKVTKITQGYYEMSL